MKKYRVVFHLDENSEERLNEVLNNIRNLIKDLGAEEVEIELVVNGQGVTLFKRGNESTAVRVRNLADEEVRFAICANSLKHYKIDPSELVERVDIVPAGVGELVRKQAEGWAYIRP